MSKNKLFLLDAYALIYRAYYAFIKTPRVNSKGQNTSAVFGFVNTLEDVLKKENPVIQCSATFFRNAAGRLLFLRSFSGAAPGFSFSFKDLFPGFRYR